MRHAARRKPSRIGTTFRTTAVSAFALGSLAVAAGSQVHAATAASHSAMDDESVRTQEEKVTAVAAAAEEKASRPVTSPEASGALKADAVSKTKGQGSQPVTDPAAVRILKMKTVAIAHAPKG